MKNLTFLIALFALVQICNAGNPKDKTKVYAGEITMQDDQVVKGNLTYDYIKSQLLLQVEDDSLTGYDATQVKGFHFKNQEYVTYEFPNANNLLVPTFFRLLWVSEGLKILGRKEALAAGGQNKKGDESSVEYLYLYGSDAKVHAYLQVQGDQSKILDNGLIAKMTRVYFRAVKQYASDHKLDFDDQKDLIKILEYYNSLKTK
ncbi:MAG: hypothetical protein JXQ96_10250 [Cyclobacteriaceae bacterium]